MSILAPIKAYFKYSMELKQHLPVIAYYCKLYAVQKGFDLMNELKDLETMKAALGQTTKEDHQPQVDNFLLSMFAKIDKEERTAPQITKNHAVDFKRCADFIAILSMFGPVDPEWQEREKYCKFKAGIILKCLKTGEEPPRGNPFAKDEEKPSVDGNMESQNEMSYEMQKPANEEVKDNFGSGGSNFPPQYNNFLSGSTPGGSSVVMNQP